MSWTYIKDEMPPFDKPVILSDGEKNYLGKIWGYKTEDGDFREFSTCDMDGSNCYDIKDKIIKWKEL